MWERTLSQKSVRLFCEQKVIDEAKADAYVYGYELLISSVVSVLLVVLIAVVCGDVRYALSFLIGFIPQRINRCMKSISHMIIATIPIAIMIFCIRMIPVDTLWILQNRTIKLWEAKNEKRQKQLFSYCSFCPLGLHFSMD